MDLATALQAVLLGIVEGITEFLPISSTGHLILVQDMLGFEGPQGNVFPIVIQLGAILSICYLYRVKLLSVAMTMWREQGARRYTLNVILAFLPAAVVGAFAHDFIKSVLFDPMVVAVALVIGGIAIIVIEQLPHVKNPRVTYDSIEAIPPSRALAVGIFQCVSMIPGTSRAAATIMGALLVNIGRQTAAEFSFIIAIPTMLGATAYDFYKNRATLSTEGMEVIAIGFVVSFFVALIVVKWLVGYVSRHGFAPFAYYRIVLGLLMIGTLLAR